MVAHQFHPDQIQTVREFWCYVTIVWNVYELSGAK